MTFMRHEWPGSSQASRQMWSLKETRSRVTTYPLTCLCWIHLWQDNISVCSQFVYNILKKLDRNCQNWITWISCWIRKGLKQSCWIFYRHLPNRRLLIVRFTYSCLLRVVPNNNNNKKKIIEGTVEIHFLSGGVSVVPLKAVDYL